MLMNGQYLLDHEVITFSWCHLQLTEVEQHEVFEAWRSLNYKLYKEHCNECIL